MDLAVDRFEQYVKESFDRVMSLALSEVRNNKEMFQEKWTAQEKALSLVAETTEMRIAHVEKVLSIQMATAQKAVEKAEAANNDRFASVNEFRGTLSDQAGRFLTRDEHAAAIKGLTDKMDASFKNWDARMDALKEYRDTSVGRSGGLTSGFGYVILAVTTVGTIIGIILALK